MQAGNGTGDPADYDQSGGGNPSVVHGASGHLEPGERSAPFTPSGSPPWSIKFTNSDTGQTCTKDGLTNSGVRVTITSWDPCAFTVDNPGGGSRDG